MRRIAHPGDKEIGKYDELYALSEGERSAWRYFATVSTCALSAQHPYAIQRDGIGMEIYVR
jgi:hypothetical protein